MTVSLSIEDGIVNLNVSDNGKGFPTENRQRLLEPYMTTRAEGTGLGLPIVAKILEDHGGGLELARQRGAWRRGRRCARQAILACGRPEQTRGRRHLRIRHSR